MTDLQVSLMAIGGTIVIGVISYNRWQEYKAKKRVEQVFASANNDAIMATDTPPATESNERHEPVLTQKVISETTIAPSETAPQQQEQDVPVAAPLSKKELPVDELIDCVIPLVLENPLRGEKILPVIQSLRHVGNKPVHFIGQREGAGWESIAHGVIYTALKAGVQLANRSSGLNELEYSELVMRLRQVADSLEAEPDLPDMMIVMASSRGLHQFVTEYDAKLSINIYSNSTPWAISTLLAALERQGFDLRPDGRLVMPDGEGGILFVLSPNVTAAGNNVTFDVIA